MTLRLPSLCILSASLIGCSSGSDNPTNPGPTEGQLADPISNPEPVDGQSGNVSSSLDAGNFETLLVASLDLLRSDYYVRATASISQAAQNWEEHYDAVVGTTLHDCEGGGTINRDVLEAPTSVDFLPQYNLVSELSFTDCVIDEVTLNGDVGWNWNESSPAQLGGTTYTNEYSFADFSIIQSDSSETITGTWSESIDIAGPGDGYTRNYDTRRFQRMDAEGTVEIVDSNYAQQFDHYIARADTANEIFHQFKEGGLATVSIQSLGIINAIVRIDPEIIYANDDTETSSIHTTSLASGIVELVMADGSDVTVTVIAEGYDTVTYTLTDTTGQQTTIEREWVAPASCQPDERFNYESC